MTIHKKRRWMLHRLLAALVLVGGAGAATIPASAQDSDAEDLEMIDVPRIVDVLPGFDVDDPSVLAAVAAGDQAIAEARANAGDASARVNGQLTITYREPVPQNVKTVIDASAAQWAAALQLNPNAPLEVEFFWTALGPGILGQAGANGLFNNNPAFPDNSLYPAPLANFFAGQDLNGPGTAEITMQLNSDINWFIGVNGQPAFAQQDLLSVALHEIAHGLGFSGNELDNPPRVDFNPPNVYDNFVENAAGQRLVALGEAAAGALLESGALFYDIGADRRIPVFAPNPFQFGSSYSHFDQSLGANSPGSMMTPALANGTTTRVIDAAILGVFDQEGWNIIPPPLTPTITASGPGPGNGTINVTFTEDLNGFGTPPRMYRVVATRNGVAESDNNIAPNPNGTTTTTINGLVGGQLYSVDIFPVDRAGRQGAPGSSFATASGAGGGDTTPPTVTFPQPTVFLDLASPQTITGTITDAGSGVNRVDVIAIDLGAAGATGVPALRHWNGNAWGPTRTVIPATLNGNTWTFNWDPIPGGSGSYVVGLQAFDNANNKWPAGKDFQALVILGDNTSPTATIGAPVDNGVDTITFSGTANDNISIRKVRFLIRHVESNEYWNGNAWITAAQAATDPSVLLTATLDAPLATNPNWTYVLGGATRAGTYSTLTWAQDGAYRYSPPVPNNYVAN